jgi:hypothetical protein
MGYVLHVPFLGNRSVTGPTHWYQDKARTMPNGYYFFFMGKFTDDLLEIIRFFLLKIMTGISQDIQHYLEIVVSK